MGLVYNSTPLLSLDEFAILMGMHPWAFNQFDISQLGQETSCPPLFQFEWQRNTTLTRELLGRVIANAEMMIAEQLTYWPAPKAFTFERIPYPRGDRAEWWNYWYNERWKLKDVRVRWGRIKSPGVLAHTTISATEAVVLSDEDGDGIDDWFTTGAIVTTVTDPEEIAIYVCDADRPTTVNWFGDEDVWRIRPVRVELDTVAGNVIISGPIYLLLDPDYTIPPYPMALDPTDSGSFLANVKIARRYIDTTDQGYVYLEQVPCQEPDCATLYATACFGDRDAVRGIVLPMALESSYPLGPPDCTTCSGECSCGYAPDFVSINYVAGYPIEDTDQWFRMSEPYATIVARLAATLLPERACNECMTNELSYWREYPFEDVRGGEPGTIVTEAMVNNPFGARRGAIWAWDRVKELNERKVAGAML